jgi:hypothetical protein
MSNQTFDIRQNIFKQAHPPIHVISIDELTLAATPQTLANFLSTAEHEDGVIGLAPVYGAKCVLTTLALSTLSQVMLVRFRSEKAKGKKKRKTNTHLTPAQALLRDNILCHPERHKYAFRMDRLSISLFLDLNLRITNGVDLLSASKSARRSIDAAMSALGGETTLHKANMIALFKHEETTTTPVKDLALQAWAACRAGTLSSLTKSLSKIPRILTLALDAKVCILVIHITYTDVFSKHLLFLAEALRDADRLEALKPTRVKNDVTGEFSVKQGKLSVSSSRFKTRIMTSPSQVVIPVVLSII